MRDQIEVESKQNKSPIFVAASEILYALMPPNEKSLTKSNYNYSGISNENGPK